MGEGHGILQDVSPDAGGLVDEIGSIQVQDVKEECRERSSRTDNRRIYSAGGASAGLLKRFWPTIGVQGDELSVEDRIRDRQ